MPGSEPDTPHQLLSLLSFVRAEGHLTFTCLMTTYRDSLCAL